MKIRNIVPLMALLATGCSMPDEILVSWAFTPEEEVMVQDALDEWAVAMDVDHGVELTFGWMPTFQFDEDSFEDVDGKATMHIVEKYDEAYQSIAFEYDTNFHGYTRYWDNWSIVMVRQNNPKKTEEENLRSFHHHLLHEFGHYLGHHNHRDGGLMAPKAKWNPLSCIDQETVNSICKGPRWNCGPNAGSTCE